MFSRVLFSIATVCLLIAPSFAQKIEQNVFSGMWLKQWLLCGPIPLQTPGDEAVRGWYHSPGYEKDYLQKFGGETNLRVKEGDVVSFSGGSARWTFHTVKDSIVDLRELLSREAPVLAYAYTEITSDRDQMMALSFGTNDGGTLWVNGKQIWDHQV